MKNCLAGRAQSETQTRGQHLAHTGERTVSHVQETSDLAAGKECIRVVLKKDLRLGPETTDINAQIGRASRRRVMLIATTQTRAVEIVEHQLIAHAGCLSASAPTH